MGRRYLPGVPTIRISPCRSGQIPMLYSDIWWDDMVIAGNVVVGQNWIDERSKNGLGSSVGSQQEPSSFAVKERQRSQAVSVANV